MLLNDIINILQCCAALLPALCARGAELAGRGGARDVRDLHAKCDELFKCAVYRGAAPHYIVQVVSADAARWRNNKISFTSSCGCSFYRMEVY